MVPRTREFKVGGLKIGTTLISVNFTDKLVALRIGLNVQLRITMKEKYLTELEHILKWPSFAEDTVTD